MTAEHRVHLARSARESYTALEAVAKTVGNTATEAGIDARLRELLQIHTSQLNGCAYCVRVHVDRAMTAGVDADTIAQLAVWRESGVFSSRERAGLELAESYVRIHDGGISDDLYNRVGAIFTEPEYVAISWILISINAFNRLAIAGQYAVPPRTEKAQP